MRNTRYSQFMIGLFYQYNRKSPKAEDIFIKKGCICLTETVFFAEKWAFLPMRGFEKTSIFK